MLTDLIFSDDLFVRLLQAKYEQDRRFDIIEQSGVNLEALRIDLLTIVLDAMGVPPEDQNDYSVNRDWIWMLYAEIVVNGNGSCEEIQSFLTTVRAGLKERGLVRQ